MPGAFVACLHRRARGPCSCHSRFPNRCCILAADAFELLLFSQQLLLLVFLFIFRSSSRFVSIGTLSSGLLPSSLLSPGPTGLAAAALSSASSMAIFSSNSVCLHPCSIATQYSMATAPVPSSLEEESYRTYGCSSEAYLCNATSFVGILASQCLHLFLVDVSQTLKSHSLVSSMTSALSKTVV